MLHIDPKLCCETVPGSIAQVFHEKIFTAVPVGPENTEHNAWHLQVSAFPIFTCISRRDQHVISSRLPDVMYQAQYECPADSDRH